MLEGVALAEDSFPTGSQQHVSSFSLLVTAGTSSEASPSPLPVHSSPGPTQTDTHRTAYIHPPCLSVSLYWSQVHSTKGKTPPLPLPHLTAVSWWRWRHPSVHRKRNPTCHQMSISTALTQHTHKQSSTGRSVIQCNRKERKKRKKNRWYSLTSVTIVHCLMCLTPKAAEDAARS